jgi:hypothetical protein
VKSKEVQSSFGSGRAVDGTERAVGVVEGREALGSQEGGGAGPGVRAGRGL